MRRLWRVAIAIVAIVLPLTLTNAATAGLCKPPRACPETSVWAWGWNFEGQLGDGTQLNYRTMPVQVLNLSEIQTIAAGGGYSLALKTDGTVWAWGDNYTGQLGNGTTIDHITPEPVLNLRGVTAIASGYIHNLALKADGTVWAWGQNISGELGDGTTVERHTPVRVRELLSNAPSSSVALLQSLVVYGYLSDVTAIATGMG